MFMFAPGKYFFCLLKFYPPPKGGEWFFSDDLDPQKKRGL